MSRRANMDYHDIDLTLPLRLSAPPQIASCSWGAVNWNQVSLCWLLTCHFASPTQTAAHKCPQPCIYPKACPPPRPFLSSFCSWQKQKRSSRLRVSSWIVLQMETITYFWPICVAAVSLLFSDVRRGRVAPEIHQVLLSLWLLRFVLTQTSRRFSEASHIC